MKKCRNRKILKNSFIFILAPTEESVSNISCTFPDWALEMGPMKSLTYTSHYEFSQGNLSFLTVFIMFRLKKQTFWYFYYISRYIGTSVWLKHAVQIDKKVLGVIANTWHFKNVSINILNFKFLMHQFLFS